MIARTAVLAAFCVVSSYAQHIPDSRSSQSGPAIRNTVALDRLNSYHGVDIYGRLKNRTVLIHPSVLRTPIDTALVSSNSVALDLLLERKFAEEGIAIVPYREKFLLAIPVSRTNAVLSRLATSPALPSDIDNPGDTNEIPAGMVDFRATPASDLLRVYAIFISRELVNPDEVPWSEFTFLSQTTLSRPELVHVFEVLLDWHGIKIVPLDGDKFEVLRLDGERFPRSIRLIPGPLPPPPPQRDNAR